jgi:transaldolase
MTSASASGGRPAVFLDRDGVINRAVMRGGRPFPPASVDELEIAPDAPAALRALHEAGYVLVCVTNQPDVARGRQRRDEVEKINAEVSRRVPLDDVRVCYHDDADRCECRKPQPGMLVASARDLHLDVTASVMVGDRWSDIEAGRRAGCRTLLLGDGHGEPNRWAVEPDARVPSLAQAAAWILARDRAVIKKERTAMRLADLTIKLFADGADKASMLKLYDNPAIKGFTTNPTLMRKAGVADYAAFAHEILDVIADRPISFEVFSDEWDEMADQARQIAGWGDNVYVKVPVTNTRGESAAPLIGRLTGEGIKVNVTALMTLAQVRAVCEAFVEGPAACVSVFAGRIADTGRDPVPLMAAAVEMVNAYPNVELIWASPRELLNVIQADAIGCHIITATSDILAKLPGLGKDLDEFSLDTVKMFRDDGVKAGFTLAGSPLSR